jgi:hypothetical protein
MNVNRAGRLTLTSTAAERRIFLRALYLNERVEARRDQHSLSRTLSESAASPPPKPACRPPVPAAVQETSATSLRRPDGQRIKTQPI